MIHGIDEYLVKPGKRGMKSIETFESNHTRLILFEEEAGKGERYQSCNERSLMEAVYVLCTLSSSSRRAFSEMIGLRSIEGCWSCPPQFLEVYWNSHFATPKNLNVRKVAHFCSTRLFSSAEKRTLERNYFLLKCMALIPSCTILLCAVPIKIEYLCYTKKFQKRCNETWVDDS